MNLTHNGTTIPNSLFEIAKYLEPREFLILSVLFYAPDIGGEELEFQTGLKPQEILKYTESLIKFGLIKNLEGNFSINTRAIDLEPLKKRAAPRVKQEKFVPEEYQETHGAKMDVQVWENFVPTMRLQPNERHVLWNFFKAMGYDVNKPFDYIIDVRDWKNSTAMLAKIVGDSHWLVEETVKKMLGDKLIISTPRSLLKVAMHVKARGGVNATVETKEDEEIRIW